MAKFPRLLSFFCFLLITACHSGQPEIYQDASGAIRGYDPVAYFQEGHPVKGRPDLTYKWNEASWHFSTQENLERFKKDPEAYAPRYGGYCAYGTAEGHKAPTEPEAFTVLDGKLFLNYNKEVLGIWNKDRPGYIRRADSNWSRLKTE